MAIVMVATGPPEEACAPFPPPPAPSWVHHLRILRTSRLVSGSSPAYPEMPSPASFWCPHAARQTVCFGCRRPAREWRACPCGSLKPELLPDSLPGEASARPSTYTDMSAVGQPVGRPLGARWAHRVMRSTEGFQPGVRSRLYPGGSRGGREGF